MGGSRPRLCDGQQNEIGSSPREEITGDWRKRNHSVSHAVMPF